MEYVSIIAQIIIALGIFNVWIIRYNKPTSWRGGESGSMKEEFATYGLPGWSVNVIGALKILLAILLIIGIWIPSLVIPSAVGMAVLMLGAIAMHIKVKDTFKKSLPALGMLLLSVIVIVFS
ncbi:MAG: DoxX family protein [Bacteroidales bacterium]|nr:DoxX family protein [Bacteroidales bacterium]MCF8334260.1 DoxX family protein [Bacteroidales bacterium]